MPRRTPRDVAERLQRELAEWAHGKTQGEVGAALGVSQGFAGEVLRGVKTPGPEIFMGLAKAEPLRLWRALGLDAKRPLPNDPRECAIEAHIMLGLDRVVVTRAAELVHRRALLGHAPRDWFMALNEHLTEAASEVSHTQLVSKRTRKT